MMGGGLEDISLKCATQSMGIAFKLFLANPSAFFRSRDASVVILTCMGIVTAIVTECPLWTSSFIGRHARVIANPSGYSPWILVSIEMLVLLVKSLWLILAPASFPLLFSFFQNTLLTKRS
jgi:hypothetical protein